MTGTSNGEVGRTAEAALGPIVDAVRHTALDLLASLAERPERLRVQAAGVIVDLDWRSGPAAATGLPAVHVEHAAHRPMEPPPGNLHDLLGNESHPNLYYVCAPTIGTFYHAPEPGAPPFVAQGALVNAGQQVGIVEAMKLMLPVEADRAGRVVEVLVANGQAVEYGERLVALVPADTD
jgi:acetyl-CoA carboxylase biotin carboxyl carrier protein